jgi:thiol-disulfide isomerase/thioredoxin
MRSVFAAVLAMAFFCPALAQSPATEADREIEAHKRLMSAEPPAAREDNPRVYYQWRDDNLKKQAAAAMAFADKYPHDPRRWNGIVQMGYSPPYFVKGFNSKFDAEPDSRNFIIDEEARAAFEARVSKYLDVLEASSDAEAGVRLGAIGLRVSAATERARRQPSAENRAALRSVVERVIRTYPNEGAAGGAAETYLHVAQAQAPAEAKAWEAQMRASKAPGVIGLVKFLDQQKASANDIRSFSFTALDGRKVDVGAMRGKVVLIDFWATWCTPCIAEFPNIKKAYAAWHGKGFEVIGVSVDVQKDQQKLVDLVKKRDLPWPQYFDGKGFAGPVAKKYVIQRVPAMFLLDPQGKVVSTDARGEKLEAEVKRLLGP